MTLGEVYPFVDGASPCGRAAKRAGRGRERFMAERKAYMERIARDKLGYVLPGEHIYVDMSGD